MTPLSSCFSDSANLIFTINNEESLILTNMHTATHTHACGHTHTSTYAHYKKIFT